MKTRQLIAYLLPSILILTTSLPARGQEIIIAASDIARTLALEMKERGKTRVAVASFRDLNGTATPLGAFLAEEIVTRLAAESGDLQIVERSQTDAIFEEQQLGIEGLRESGRLDAFVKIHQVDALVVGSLATLAELGDRTRINARLIAVPTGEILTSASALIKVEGVTLDPAPPNLPRKPSLAIRDTWRTIALEALGCRREGRDLVCEVLVTNNDRDRDVTFNRTGTHLYDQRGRRYQASSIRVANIQGSSVEMRLVAEVPTNVTVFFEGLPSGIALVKLLDLYLYASGWSSGNAELRNVPVEQ